MRRRSSRRKRERAWRRYIVFVLGHHDRWTAHAQPFIKELTAIRNSLRHRPFNDWDEACLNAMHTGRSVIKIIQSCWLYTGEKEQNG